MLARALSGLQAGEVDELRHMFDLTAAFEIGDRLQAFPDRDSPHSIPQMGDAGLGMARGA